MLNLEALGEAEKAVAQFAEISKENNKTQRKSFNISKSSFAGKKKVKRVEVDLIDNAKTNASFNSNKWEWGYCDT